MKTKRVIKVGFLSVFGILFLGAVFFIVLINLPNRALPTPPLQEDLIIKNVSIIDIENESIRKEENLLIQDGIIVRITKDQLISNNRGVKIIDGSGKYLIPGLNNMHVHTIKYSPRLHFPLMIANGVTGYREMGLVSIDSSASFFTHTLDKKRWNKKILSGEFIGPIMLSVASHVVESKESMGYVISDYDTSISDKILVEKFVRKSLEEGADFIKIQLEEADKQIFDSIYAYSELYNSKLNGHAPEGIDLIYSIKRMGSLEHARDLLHHATTVVSGRKGEESVGTYLGKIADSVDQGKLQSVLDSMSFYNTAYVPTHLTRKWEAYLDNEAYLEDERVSYVPYIQKILWKIDQSIMMDLDSSNEGRLGFMRFYEKGLDVTKLAYDSGVLIMTGTDALDSYVFYGFSVHDELKEMVKTGLSTYEALKTATINPAKFLNLQDDIGSIREGVVADIVILKNNPIEDISNTKDIYGVIHQGRYYDLNMITKLKEFSEKEASSFALNAKMTWSLIKDVYLMR